MSPILLLSFALAHAETPWDEAPSHLPLRRDGALLVDPAGDGTPDLYDGARAVGAWTTLGDHTLLFRAILGEAPAPDGAWPAAGVGFGWDADGDDRLDEVVAVVDGAPVWLRASGDAWTPALWTVLPEVRLVAGPNGTVRAEIAVAFEALGDALPWDAEVRFAVLVFDGTPETLLDRGGCDEDACDGIPLADPVILDADADGLPLPTELGLGTLPDDADSDDDGVIDGLDPDPRSCDADGDGLLDPVEMGLVEPDADTDPAGCFVPDADPATRTDPRAADTDGGGIPDGVEDRNRNGAHDGPDAWETDPLSDEDDADRDGDGLADVLEVLGEGGDDVDRDGIPDIDDPDADQDGLPDGVDGVEDPDGDGLPAFRDYDADGDGLVDGKEGTGDPDGDGIPPHLDTDSDGDGIGDRVETNLDFDRDGIPNHLDLDADGDGIPDAEEGEEDRDCDGRPDFLDVIPDDGFCEPPPAGTVDDSPFGRPFRPITPASADDLEGCGCAQARGGGLGLLGALALLVRRRRR